MPGILDGVSVLLIALTPRQVSMSCNACENVSFIYKTWAGGKSGGLCGIDPHPDFSEMIGQC